MMSFRLNILSKMLKFCKVTSANLKLGNLPLSEQAFSGVFVNKFDSKSRQFEVKVVFFFERVYHAKMERGKNDPCVKQS